MKQWNSNFIIDKDNRFYINQIIKVNISSHETNESLHHEKEARGEPSVSHVGFVF